MALPALAKIATPKAADICKDIPLRPEAKQLVRDGQTPAQFLDVLLEKQDYLAAIDFLAYALPKREAVWWCCLCLRQCLGPKLEPKPTAALMAAVQWVLEPSEDNRRAAQVPGEEAGVSTPAGLAATAAFWSGGSLLPPNLPEVPPSPFMTAKAVSGAIKLLSTKCDAVDIPDRQRLLLDLGIGLAEGAVHLAYPGQEDCSAGSDLIQRLNRRGSP